MLAKMKKAFWIVWMVCGSLSTLWLVGKYFVGGLCQGPILHSLINGDKSVKASVYEVDCGAMMSTQTVVVLSAWNEDGRHRGDLVVTFLHMDGDNVQMTWRTTRDLVISYPARADVEYAVSKTFGVKIYLQPQTP